jgi:hypothetical protein
LTTLFLLALSANFQAACSKKDEESDKDKKSKKTVEKAEENKTDKTEEENNDQKLKEPEKAAETPARLRNAAQEPSAVKTDAVVKSEKAVRTAENTAALQQEPSENEKAQQMAREKTAAQEKTPENPVKAIKMPDIDRILTPLDVNQIAGKKISFESGVPLPGIPASDTYRSLFYNPKGKKDKFGFGIQIWKLSDPLKAKQKYQDLLYTIPHAQDVIPVANQTLFGYWEDILYISFSSLMDNFVVMISCNREICNSDAIYNLGKLVAGRLK